jgi:DHA3 family macrolide efflux protein-like MFS transporter
MQIPAGPSEPGAWGLRLSLVLAGQFFSKLSTTTSQLAIIWYLALSSHSSLLLAAASIAAFMPQALLGPLAGTLVDRLAKKKVLIAADMGVAALALVVVVAGQLTALPTTVLLAILALRSIGEAFHTPALQSVMPLLAPREKLVNVAGFMQMIQAAPLLISPSLAALLLGFFPYHLVVGIDVAGALLAVSLLAFLAIPKDVNRWTKRAASASPFGELREGFQVLRHHRGLFALTLFSPVFLCVLVATKPLLPLMAFDYFGGTTWHAGLIETGFALGIAVGGLAIGIGGGFKNRVHAIVAACLLVGVCELAAGLLPPEGFAFFVVLFTIAGVSNALFTSTVNALYQQLIPTEFLGRVFAMITSLMLLAMPLGLAWGGAVAEMTNPSVVFSICGALMALLGLVVLLPPSIRQLGQTTLRELSQKDGRKGEGR